MPLGVSIPPSRTGNLMSNKRQQPLIPASPNAVVRQPGIGIDPLQAQQSLQSQFPGASEQEVVSEADRLMRFQEAIRQREMASSFMGGAQPEEMAHGGQVKRTASMMSKNLPLYRTNEEGVEAFQPKGGEPLLIEGGEQIRTFPTDGKVIPADRTSKLMRQGRGWSWLAPESSPSRAGERGSQKPS
jgi:hypothetical protein